MKRVHLLKSGSILSEEEVIQNDISATESTTESNGENSLYKSRPVRHLGDICLCYPDPKDCTTCNLSDSILSDNEDDSKEFSHNRLEAGSSLVASKSESSYYSLPSSIFEIFENISGLEANTDDLVTSIDSIFRTLSLELSRFRDSYYAAVNTFRQTFESSENHKAEGRYLLEILEEKLEVEKRLNAERPARIIETLNEIDHIEAFLNKATTTYKRIRDSHLYRLLDEDLMTSNQIRISEMRQRICEIPENIDEQVSELDKQLRNLFNKLEENG